MALERIGAHVRDLTIRIPHSPHSFLPPLLDLVRPQNETAGAAAASHPSSARARPNTAGSGIDTTAQCYYDLPKERTFIYQPQLGRSSSGAVRGGEGSAANLRSRLRLPKYGSWELTDLLTRQYPPLFHAATNVPAFVRALQALPNLQRLEVACPSQEASHCFRRSAVDYALISLRIAVETVQPALLEELVLKPMHPAGLQYLSPSPATGVGAGPAASRPWKRIRRLDIELESFSAIAPDHLKLLHAYLRAFTGQLTDFNFRWIGVPGPSPFTLDTEPNLFQPLHTEKPDYQQSHQPGEYRRHQRRHQPRRMQSQYSFEQNLHQLSSQIAGHLQPVTPSALKYAEPLSPPVTPPSGPSSSSSTRSSSESARSAEKRATTSATPKPLNFIALQRLKLTRCATTASQLRDFFSRHAKVILAADFDEVSLTGGSWDDAAAPLLRSKRGQQQDGVTGTRSRSGSDRSASGVSAAMPALASSSNNHERLQPTRYQPTPSYAESMEVPIMLGPVTVSVVAGAYETSSRASRPMSMVVDDAYALLSAGNNSFLQPPPQPVFLKDVGTTNNQAHLQPPKSSQPPPLPPAPIIEPSITRRPTPPARAPTVIPHTILPLPRGYRGRNSEEKYWPARHIFHIDQKDFYDNDHASPGHNRHNRSFRERARGQIADCEEHLRRFLRGTVFAWR